MFSKGTWWREWKNNQFKTKIEIKKELISSMFGSHHSVQLEWMYYHFWSVSLSCSHISLLGITICYISILFFSAPFFFFLLFFSFLNMQNLAWPWLSSLSFSGMELSSRAPPGTLMLVPSHHLHLGLKLSPQRAFLSLTSSLSFFFTLPIAPICFILFL